MTGTPNEPESLRASSPGERPARFAGRALVVLAYLAALALPAYAFFHDRGGTGFLVGADPKVALQLLFPVAGLYAFTFVTLQVLITTNLYWLARLWPGILRFHRAQGLFTLGFALLHPAMILAGFGLANFLASDFVAPGLAVWLVPAYVALAFLLLTVVTAMLGWSGRHTTWWRQVHRLNYGVFALVWLHSWNIGSDTTTPLLRGVWISYLVVVVASTVGRYLAPRVGVAARLTTGGSRP